jgi:hypothetical protein
VRTALACILLTAGAVGLAGCDPGLPEGKSWTVDGSAWVGSPQCPQRPCALDGYRTRDFATDVAVPGALVDGASVVVRCFVPTPAPQQDPTGRQASRWYLISVDDVLLWAPDLALTSEPDLRAVPAADADPAAVLAAAVSLCDSQVPGR